MTSVYCPATFQPEDLPRKEERFAGGIGYLLHTVMMGRVHDSRYRKGHRRGFVPIKATFMRAIVGRHAWAPIRSLALALGLVECDNKFLVGRRAKGYRILPPHSAVPWQLCELDNTALARRLKQWRRERRQAEWDAIQAGEVSVAPDVCSFLFDNLQRVRLKKDAPLDQFAPEVAIAADMIRRGRWFFHVDNHGRIHTNISNLKKELRAYLDVDGETLRNLDIANSQPLFVGILAVRRRRGKGTGGGEGREGLSLRGLYDGQTDMSEVTIQNGLDEYLDLCEEGRLYHFVFDHLPGIRERLAGLGQAERDRLFQRNKHQVLATLYDVDSHRNRVYRILDKHFPGLMEFVRREKRGDHRRFAHLAQRTESDFMFGQVVPRLMREQPDMFVGTIHDSVLAPALEAEYVRGVMMSEFGRLGVTPRVRIE